MVNRRWITPELFCVRRYIKKSITTMMRDGRHIRTRGSSAADTFSKDPSRSHCTTSCPFSAPQLDYGIACMHHSFCLYSAKYEEELSRATCDVQNYECLDASVHRWPGIRSFKSLFPKTVIKNIENAVKM